MKKLLLLCSVVIWVMLMGVATMAEDKVEETTEATTQIYENYDEYYKGKDLKTGEDVPVGAYRVIPDYEKFAAVGVYQYGNSTTNPVNDKKCVYYANYENSGLVYLSADKYVNVSNGALVPLEKSEKFDASQNGWFYVGKDIMPGKYTFKIDPSTKSGCVELRSLSENKQTEIYNLYENNEYITINLTKDTVLKKYGVDIYNNMLRLVYDYTPKTDITTDVDEKYNFENVSASYKQNVVKDLREIMKTYGPGASSNTKFSKNYYNIKVDAWKSAAQNNDEKKFADYVISIYDRFRNFAQYATPEKGYATKIKVGTSIMSGSEYSKMLSAEKDSCLDILQELGQTESFRGCELAKYKAFSLYYGIPKGQGTIIEK